jgi:hypothetical protein
LSCITFKVKVTLVLTTTELTFMILREDIDREIASVEYALEHSNWNEEDVAVRDVLRARLVILSDLRHNTDKLDSSTGWEW